MASMKAYQARYLFPGEGDPIERGNVAICDGRIVELGKSTAEGVEDLGDVALLPGLINVHCHLEFSQLDSPLGSPSIPFADWIRRVISWRQSVAANDDTYWIQGIGAGLNECLAAGVTCIGDIVTVDNAHACYQQYPGQSFLFRELLGLTRERSARLSEIARLHVTATSERDLRFVAGLSPHAPYTTPIGIIRDAAQLSRQFRFPVAMHLAESQDEIELLRSHSGPLVDLLEELDAWDPRAVPRTTTCRDYVDALSQSHRSLLVHGNYLGATDWEQIAQHADRMSVVYCPRTHHFFGHSRYRFADMHRAGVKVAIATDGRSSNPDLNLMEDLRAAARWHTDVDPAVILRAATLTAAEALGCEKDRGSLQFGKLADMIAVPIDPRIPDPWEALFDSHAPPARVFLRGEECRERRT
jgi:cytosine/adenosine deaminase-related metal-dependent hydrolase